MYSVSLSVLTLPLALAALAAALNVFADGGPLFTLPARVFAGLDPTLANGTHRVSLVRQNPTATGGFGRRHNVELGESLKLSCFFRTRSMAPGCICAAVSAGRRWCRQSPCG